LITINLVLFILVFIACLDGYRRRRPWLLSVVYLLIILGRNRSGPVQLLIYGSITVSSYMLCNWLNYHGWRGLAYSGIILMMTIGLECMRSFEEWQKGRNSDDS